MANAVRFIYVPGSQELPETLDSNAIYFVEGDQQLWAQNHLIANYTDGDAIESALFAELANYHVKSVEVDPEGQETYTSAIVDAELDENGNLVLTRGDISVSIEIGQGIAGDGILVDADDPSFDIVSNLNADGTTISPVVSRVTLSGFASEQYVDDAISHISGAMHFLGVSSTPIVDGQASVPTIDGEPVPISELNPGDVVLYDSSEFVWDGSVWKELGDASSYVLKTTRIIGGDKLSVSGDGSLVSDVTVSHDAVSDSDITVEQEITTDGHASDWDNINPDGDIRFSIVDTMEFDRFGHITSVSYQDMTEYLAKFAKYFSGESHWSEESGVTPNSNG